jgi:hypothetical protein
VNDLEEYQIQFDVSLDGAYLYIDRCGEFMRIARKEFGFVPLAVNPTGCNMEAPDIALQLQASGDAIILTCTNPKFAGALFKAAEIFASAAIELFDPFSVEHFRLTSRSIRRTATMEESFKQSIKFFPSQIDAFGEIFNLPALNQDIAFSYESGTRRFHFKISPVAFNVTAIERKLPILGTPKGYGEFLLRKERSVRNNAAQPGYGLGLELSLLETNPTPVTNVLHLNDALVDYRKRLLAKLSK